MKFIANLKDASGCIRTGYENTLEGTREECMRDYLYHIRVNCNMEEITENDVDLQIDGLSKEDARLLGRITTRDEAGTHFTQIYSVDFLDEMEKAGYIEIYRPVHEPSGIPYSQEEWTVKVTPAGIEAGEAINWGEED